MVPYPNSLGAFVFVFGEKPFEITQFDFVFLNPIVNFHLVLGGSVGVGGNDVMGSL